MTITLEHALSLYHAGQRDAAQHALVTLVEQNPTAAAAWHLLGIVLLEKGDVVSAIAPLSRAVELAPGDANHYAALGHASFILNRDDVARLCFQTAIQLGLDNADLHHNLAEVLMRQSSWDEAAEHFERSLQFEPHNPVAHLNLAAICQQRQDWSAAETHLRQALAQQPDFLEAESSLSILLTNQYRCVEALPHVVRAWQLQPHSSDALARIKQLAEFFWHSGDAERTIAILQPAADAIADDLAMRRLLGLAYFCQGDNERAEPHLRAALVGHPQCLQMLDSLSSLLHTSGRDDEAETLVRQMLTIDSEYMMALNRLGVLLTKRHQDADAIVVLQKAAARNPEVAAIHNNLGNAYLGAGQFELAAEHLQRAISLSPKYLDAFNNLAKVQQELGEFATAAATIDQALQFAPDDPVTHSHRAMLQLLRGDLANGWSEYEWRWRTNAFAPRSFSQPIWSGESLAGKTILVHAEQGLGDTLHFVRYTAELQSLGARVIFETQLPLAKLLARCAGIDQLIVQGDAPPPHDFDVSLLSVPRILGTTLDNVPRRVPYIFPDPQLVDAWRARFEQWPGFRVGINWQGNPKYITDRTRSVPLTFFAELAKIPGVTFFSVQKGFGREQLGPLRDVFPVVDLADELDQQTGAFMDTAAVMQNLDLVITSDTAVPHLAGSLGVPVWMALPFVPDWRWLLQRDDSPWYPTMRIFRQPKAGDWSSVFARIGSELSRTVGERHYDRGQRDVAKKFYCQAIEFDAANPLAHNSLGTVLADDGQCDQAIASFRTAFELAPSYVEASTNLANALIAAGRSDEALTQFQHSLQVAPQHPLTLASCGNLLRDRGELDGAVQCYCAAIQADPTLHLAAFNLGCVLVKLRRLDEAVAAFRRVVQATPEAGEAWQGIGIAELLRGNWELGWKCFEGRLSSPVFGGCLPASNWHGEPLAGRSILLRCEQGLGDTLQFIRYAELIQQRGGRVVCECQPPLVPLLRSCRFIDELIPRGTPLPSCDFHAPLLSLPGIFQTRLETIPANVPYLQPTAELVADWRQRLAKWPGLRVGINWQGNPNYSGDRERSIPFAEFETLADVAGVTFFSLQKGFGREQLLDKPSKLPVVDLGDELDVATGAFMDTAAVMANLDLVITSDTAIPHLAGALGIQTWVALAWAPDWRFLLDREDSPWYPTMRLFRQPTRQDWPAVFQRIRDELRCLVRRRTI